MTIFQERGDQNVFLVCSMQYSPRNAIGVGLDVHVSGIGVSVSLGLQIPGQLISRTPGLIHSHELPRTLNPSRLEADPMRRLLVIPGMTQEKCIFALPVCIHTGAYARKLEKLCAYLVPNSYSAGKWQYRSIGSSR